MYNQPPIAIQPASQTNGLGGTVTFTTTGTTFGPYGYQWQLNGTNIAGATGSTLTITNLSLTNQGDYTVIVTNQAGDWWESSDSTLVVSNVYIGITMQPMSQMAYEPDTVTFAVTAAGTNLTYQWQAFDPGSGTFTNIPNANGDRYTLYNIQYGYGVLQSGQVGTFDVVISNGVGSISSSSATLTDMGAIDPVFPVLPIFGPRQDYTFKGNTTYSIGAPYNGIPGGANGSVDLYGNTTIEGGTVIKFDYDLSTNVGLIIHGDLKCRTQPYHPATMTVAFDDSQGEQIYGSSGIPPSLGSSFLNLDDAHPLDSLSISNLRFFYADQAVTTPTNTGVLQVWDCQFYGCDSAINSKASRGCSTNQLHNVLFAECDFAVAAQNDCAEVDAEQVTANVLSFCDTEFYPSRLRMTNCIVVGDIGDGPVTSLQNVVTPSAWPFQSVNDGNYYLPIGSPYHSNGTVNISQRMLAELAHKTTFAPISFPTNMTISGQLTLFPQAVRYTGGAPDLGYAYDPLDYTIADMVVQGGGTIVVLPGAAIGFRNDSLTGIYLEDGSLLTSQGTPTKPIIFTDNTLIQEGSFAPGQVYNQYLSWLLGFANYGGPAFFVPLPTQNDNWDAAPQLNMHFCNFEMTQDDFGVEAGYSQLNDGGYPLSFSSSIVWNMQDCTVEGGQIVLGDQYSSTANPPGSVSWLNNLFDETIVFLQPSYGTGTNSAYVDLPFQANNNLFKGGILALDPTLTSQGNWQFRNNLFDMEAFWQNTSQPLDYNYNGWWTNAGSKSLLISSLAGQLTPAQTDDGSTDGSNDRTLTNRPPYRCGPFGEYYMSQGTVLAAAGSTTADQLGLFHYTTMTNQAAQSNSVVDIGLHYLAASKGPLGWVPLDTDGDGIPDYVEDATGNGATGSAAVALGETDWLNPMTDGVNYDSSNAAYLNIDLAGDGIVGRVATNVNLNPLLPDNPFTLTQVITGEEPDIATFEVPISYSLLTNIGQLTLLVDGTAPLLQDCEAASNGMSLLVWNVDYSGWNDILDSTGLTNATNAHYLQAEFALNGQLAGPQNLQPNTTVYTALGPVLPLSTHQILQFEPFYGTFDDNGGTLFANLPQFNAQYTINLYDDSTGEFILGITNSTTSGQINEAWGGTNSDGSPYTGDTIDAYYNVNLSDPDHGAAKQKINRVVTGVQDGDFLISYANTGASFQDQEWFADERGVVDYLMQASTTGYGLIPHPYASTLNVPDYDGTAGGGNPGFLANQTQVPNLITNIGMLINRNFFWDGHGSEQSLGDGGNPPGVDISIGDIFSALQNKIDTKKGISLGHPYRFVFMNACHTADSTLWCKTFGIIPNITSAMASQSPDKVQGFLGWHGSPRCPESGSDWNNIQQTYALFFYKWQNNVPLATCTNLAENPGLSWPLNKHFSFFQTHLGSVNNNFNLQLWGYRGINRTGYAPGF